MRAKPPSAFFLVGPTAVGKTAVAQLLALERGADVLSADSMLVYRGMNIGTAKPTAAERAGATYAGIDLVDPNEGFHVAAYAAAAAAALAQSRTAGRPTIVVGGTGLYVQCLLHGLAARPAANPAWRAEAEALLAARGLGALQALLRQLEPNRWQALTESDRQNPRRLIRAIELARHPGPPADPPPAAHPAAIQRPPLIGLRCAPALHWERIQARVRTMYAQGLLEEVQQLRASFPEWSASARQAIGYAEALDALDGRCSVATAQERTAVRTRQLAKRQMTWFRHQTVVHWVEVTAATTTPNLAAAMRKLWDEHGPTPTYY